MKNLHKKVSAVLLAGAVLAGSSLSNGLIVHASSNKFVAESRMFIARYPGGFIGDSEEFLKVYDELMKDVPEKEIKAYEKIMEKINKAVKDLPVKYYFRLNYVGIPNNVLDGLKKAGYNSIQEMKGSASPNAIVNFLYKYRQLHEKNYVVNFRDKKGKIYKFIIYVESRDVK